MIVFTSDKVQDTVKINHLPSKDLSIKSIDTLSVRSSPGIDDNIAGNDTTLVCSRNSFTDISFYDEGSFVRNLKLPVSDRTVIVLVEKSKDIKAENKEVLLRHLKNGEEVPSIQPNTDFILLILVAAAFLLTIVRSTIKNFQPVARFFLFRGLNEHSSSETGVLFHWQTTLLNLMSFFIISLFVYQAASFQGSIPSGLRGSVFWLICLLVVISALTIRHLICVVTGNLSGHSDIFNEYLVNVYQSYHFTALVFFVLIVLASFTVLLPVKLFVTAGICGLAIMYIIRVIRLFLIFMNRNISIFYLILYLCALEILPVAILFRYFSDL